VAAQPQVAASITRLPCACLHIVTRAKSEESGRAAADAKEMHGAGGVFGGICIITKSKCTVTHGMPMSNHYDVLRCNIRPTTTEHTALEAVMGG
jgi:hypothetical protein